MAKTTRALSGAAKDAYFKVTLESEAGLDRAISGRLLDTLKASVSQVRVRLDRVSRWPETVSGGVDRETAEAEPFDPFTPNVILLLRTSGRDAVLAALRTISADNLRSLAREQQLSIGGDLSTADEIREAVVTAAERRVANRKAAAG